MQRFYTELNPSINYTRNNLRWDAWGAYTEDFFLKDHINEILNILRNDWGVSSLPRTPGVKMDDLKVPKSRLDKNLLAGLSKILPVKTDLQERVFHSAGRSYYDVIRLRFNLLKDYVDGVVYPKTEEEISSLLLFCKTKKIAVVPFGGGSSVVGGVEARKGKQHKAVISVDMTDMKELVDIDPVSCTASFQAGIYGPVLENLLNERGFTLGHFPQSFEYSTLGGWIAARSSGQQSGKYGRIDKIINSARILTPNGTIETWKVPLSSAGPDMNQIISGSEGLLGIITQVTLKIQPLPKSRKYFGIVFPDFASGVGFIREANRKGLKLSMMRLSDKIETNQYSRFGTIGKPMTAFRRFKYAMIEKILQWNDILDNRCALIGGVDSDEIEVERQIHEAKQTAKHHGGFFAGEGPGKNWLKSRYNMPFLRNHLLENGIGVDTLETVITYDRILTLHKHVEEAIKNTMQCTVMCHVSHSYADGASLYFTIIFPLDLKDPCGQWMKMKKAASDAIYSSGGSISHHHGVGTDHQEWYLKQAGETAVTALKGLKNSLDKEGIMNPGKLFS